MVISLKFLDTHIEIEYLFILAAYLIEELQRFVPEDDKFLLQTIYLFEIGLFTAGVTERLFAYLLHLFSDLLYVSFVGCEKLCLVAMDDVLYSYINKIDIPYQVLMRLLYDFFVGLSSGVDFAFSSFG